MPRQPPTFLAPPDLISTVTYDVPLDAMATLRGVRTFPGGDPTHVVGAGGVAKAFWTLDGPVTVMADARVASEVTFSAWGAGAEHGLKAARGWLGLDDNLEEFDPSHHPVVAQLAAKRRGLRQATFGSLAERLVPVILGQKIIAAEAHRSYKRLIAKYGSDAPGIVGLRLAPTSAVLAELGSHEYHAVGVERMRADIVRRVAREGARLDRLVDGPLPDAYKRLRSIRGVGAWTCGSVGGPALGDPDVFAIGDYNVPHTVTFALAGERRGTDERMVELLEPFVGHRGRVVNLLKSGGVGPARRGPKWAFRNIEDH